MPHLVCLRVKEKVAPDEYHYESQEQRRICSFRNLFCRLSQINVLFLEFWEHISDFSPLFCWRFSRGTPGQARASSKRASTTDTHWKFLEHHHCPSNALTDYEGLRATRPNHK